MQGDGTGYTTELLLITRIYKHFNIIKLGLIGAQVIKISLFLLSYR